MPFAWRQASCLENFSQLWIGISLCLPPYDRYITTVTSLALKELMFPITRHWNRQKGKSSSFCFKIHHTSNKYKQLQCRIGAKRNQWCWTPTERSSCNMGLRSGSKTKPWGPSRRRVLACHPSHLHSHHPKKLGKFFREVAFSFFLQRHSSAVDWAHRI